MRIATTLLMTVFTTTALAAGPICKDIFMSPESAQEVVDRTIKELSILRFELDQQRTLGNNSVAATALESDFHKRESSLLAHLRESKIMTAAQYLERMRNVMSSLQKSEKENLKETEARKQKEAKLVQEDGIIGKTAIFNRIEPGSFQMGDGTINVTVTKPFEMMKTLTTQHIWKTVAEMAFQRFGPDAFKMRVEPSTNKGDLKPVESVDYEEIQEWLNALNMLSMVDEPGLSDIIRHHKKGDAYRLPTNADWEFVARARGQNTGKYVVSDLSQMHEYAWVDTKLVSGVKEVGLKKPFVIDGKEFFDMFGNVAQVIADGPYDGIVSGADPFSPRTDYNYTRGGSYRSEPKWLGLSESDRMNTWRAEDIGFRFLRESK